MAERMQATIPVFIYLLDDEHRVYLQRRYNTGYFDGYYEPPAGKVDEGEFPPDAACREAREEAGIEVQPDDLELFHSYINLSNNKPWLGLMFRTSKWKGSPDIQEPDKCDDAGFYSLDSLPQVTPQVADGLARIATAHSIEMSTYSDIT
jgi:8-oxo-dGTP pyrophosphatase MutT (NUDIX family)